TAKVADGAVKFSVKQLVRRDEQRKVPACRERIMHLRQREKIVFDMFEYVQTHNRIEGIGKERVGRFRGQIELSYVDVRIASEEAFHFVRIAGHYIRGRPFTPFSA